MKTILDLTCEEAKLFFLSSNNYCNFDLPKYYNFQPLLDALSEAKGWETVSVRKAKKHPDVNYKFFTNKDGMFAWRPFQLINPASYVELVRFITETDNWKTIVDRFKEFQQNERIKCCSLPVCDGQNNSDKQTTILNWWNEIEQQSIELAMNYTCFLNTDITDCYGSIYTHSISWALHGFEPSKKNKLSGGPNLLGDYIDERLEYMSYAQTNGIPQGSTLMDFIAEMVLGYADLELSNKINEYNQQQNVTKIEDYQILRYRDDYRIFGNSHELVVKIAKILTEVLQKLNFKLNTHKTFISDNIIRDAIKPDKYYWNEIKQKESNLQKQLLIIHSLAQKFPNSGSVVRALDDFYQSLHSLKVYKETKIKILISILVDIAYRNPRVYSITTAAIGKLLTLETDLKEKQNIYAAIKQKFSMLPNSGFMQIWLQRLTIKINEHEEYDEPLCKKVVDQTTQIWNVDWLPSKMQQIFESHSIIDTKTIATISEIIEPDEIQEFNSY